MAKGNSSGGMGYGDRPLVEVFQKVGTAVCRLDHLVSSSWRGQVEFAGLSLRPPQTVGGEWLVVLRGYDEEGGPVVAFHSALGGGEALAGAVDRMSNGNLKWKPDQYR